MPVHSRAHWQQFSLGITAIAFQPLLVCRGAGAGFFSILANKAIGHPLGCVMNADSPNPSVVHGSLGADFTHSLIQPMRVDITPASALSAMQANAALMTAT